MYLSGASARHSGSVAGSSEYFRSRRARTEFPGYGSLSEFAIISSSRAQITKFINLVSTDAQETTYSWMRSNELRCSRIYQEKASGAGLNSFQASTAMKSSPRSMSDLHATFHRRSG